ncbi:hypothetical protein O3P69_016861 [Scylla paramamosain]|uniref:tetrahydrofolate synthase n=1 Tax=Scylla paramamosain TaxID=85552 RepID=A0AAW0SZG2_SCYPA
MARLFHATYCQWRQWRRLSAAPRMAMAHDSQGVRKLATHCQAEVDHHYEEAVQTLNSLQSNAAVLQRIRQQRGFTNNVQATECFLDRVGISLKDLDSLSVIHIAGTKGKGSTCSFVESILREHGFRTGFYSSPHLVAVRERIRINGQPISKEDFITYFWDVYNQLIAKKTCDDDMPAYFKFLTVLALKIFVKEEVDVAVLEVGLGGEYDCTNVVRKPVVCGVTTLDYDHTSILGNTIESIAWHKAGIMKPGVPTFTVEQSLQPSLSVLLQRAKEKQVPLYLIPPLENYGWGAQPLQLGLAGNVQYCNASLALQLTQYWMNSQNRGRSDEVVCTTTTTPDHLNVPVAIPFTLSDEDVLGLKYAVWPGRSQVMVSGPLTFFLDGAHTPVSMQACVDWFLKTAPMHAPQNGDNIFRLLFFNSTGDRDPETLLKKLTSCNFDLAIFTTNLVTTSMKASSDQTNYTISRDQAHLRCEQQRNSWIRLIRNQSKQESESPNHEDTEMADTSQSEGFENNLNLTSSMPASDVPSIIFPCIQDALVWLSCGRDPNLTGELLTPPAFPPPARLQEATQVQILVTGSLHLVGGVLGVIDPELRCATHVRSAFNKPPSLTDLVLNNYNKFSSPGTP